MAQIGYNTITITDTNDIERIYTVYAKSTSNTDAPSSSADSWTESISTAPGNGDYIWQRTVVKKSGTGELTYSTPVCVTGPEGDQGKGVKSLVTQYYLSTASDSVTGGSWSPTPQSYPTTGIKYYWTKTITTYTDNSTYESTPVYNVALTNSVKDARDANTTANEAKGLSEQTHVDVVNLQTRTKYFWTNLVAHTNGASGWTKPNYPAGTYAASGISGTTFDYENSSTYGYNTLYSNGIKLRYNAINLGELDGTSLTFYNPSTTSQGTKAMELSGSALKFYASNGSTVQAEFGGTKARVSGTIEALDGQIGNNANNYWYIGNYVDYNQNQSAAIKSYGTAFIQLGSSNTWRIATNRFHSAWNDDSSGTSGQLHYPVYDSKYWDSGLHLPTSSTDKFLYIRNAPNTQTLENLQNDLEDSGYDYWTYRFYISADGSLYARNLYVLDDNGNTTQIGGTDGVYLLKSGGTITGNLEVNGTLTKGSKNVAYFTTTPTTGQVVVTDDTTGGVKTTGYTIAKSVPSNALFTDANVVQTATTTNSAYELLFSGTADNTTRTEGARKTSTLTYNPSTKALVTGGTVNGYTLAAASAKGVDTSMAASSTSTNLPTTKAVADLIATYLPLTGGTLTGALDINDELYADSATFGNLIVTGVGRFTNGIYGDLTGDVTGNVTGSLTGNATTATTATKVGNNLIIKLNSGTTEGTNMFTFNGSAAKTVDVTKSAIGLGNVENKSSATIRGELTSANVTTALGFTPYDSTNPNGYVTSSGVTSITLTQGTGISIGSSGTAITTTGSRTIALADNYGDTKNPYASKTARYVLAAPASAAGAPTFRALTNADVGLDNVTNNKQVKGLSSGTTSGHLVTWGSDGYTVADSGITKGNIVKSIASNNDGKLILTYADDTTSDPITVKIIGSEGSSVSYADALNVNGTAVGSATIPVYFDTNGKPKTANTYAGGTAVTLNGSSKASSTASFYAPTAAGTSGQYLKSSGSGAPTWDTFSKSTVGLGNVDNTSDANKPISTAQEAAFKKRGIEFISGTQTAATGSWTGVSTQAALYDGMTIDYWLPYAGSGNATLNLTLSGGGTTGAIACYYGGTTRLTTHYGVGNIIRMTYRENVPIGGSGSYTGWWANAQYYANTISQLRWEYSTVYAGTAGIFPYTLFMMNSSGNYESLVTSSSTGTSKAKNTVGFVPGQIFYNNLNATTTDGNKISGGNYAVYYACSAIDLRYSTNISTTALTVGKPVYLKGTMSNGLFYLADTWWTQTLPTSDDGFIYMYLGGTYNYATATTDYRINLVSYHPMYWYKNGCLQEYVASANYAVSAASATSATTASKLSNLSSSDTASSSTGWRKVWFSYSDGLTGRPALSDALTFQTSTGTLKATIFSGALSGNATSATKANITTTANAIAYYTGTDGTFGTKASANGALYATSANGALNWGTLPVGQGGTGVTTFTSDAALIGNGTGAIQTRSITNNTSASTVTASTNLITANTLAYWTGSSNLTTAKVGTLASAATYAATTSVASGGTGLPTAGAVYTAIRAASDTYVTLTTAQTVSGVKTFSNGAKFGTHWNISEDSTTNALVFKYVS